MIQRLLKKFLSDCEDNNKYSKWIKKQIYNFLFRNIWLKKLKSKEKIKDNREQKIKNKNYF